MPISLFDRKIVQLIVSLALFMEALDTTVINTAIPVMSQEFHVNPVDLKIALISYLLSLAVLIPISGWLADKFGQKKVFMIALVIFTASSFWCGFSNHLTELVIARILQGIGGALTLPVGRLIIASTFPRNQLINIMGHVAMIATIGLMLGPVVGGLITHYLSWPWIFWVNVPVGIITFIMAFYWLKESEPKTVPTLDSIGFILFGVGLSALTFSLSALSQSRIPESIVLTVLGFSILFLILYALHSRHKRHPIINIQLFHLRTFQVSIFGNLLCRLGFGGVPFLLPLLLQIEIGYSPQLSGLLLAPLALGVMAARPFSFKLIRLLGYKRLLIINTVLLGVSIATMILITPQTALWAIGLSTFFFGALISLQYSCMNSLAFAGTSAEQLSDVTSIMGTIQQIAQSFGIAFCAILIRIYSPSLALTQSIFNKTFISMSIVTICSLLIFIRLTADDGLEMTKTE